MNVGQYFDEVYRRSTRSRENVATLISDLRASFTTLREALGHDRNDRDSRHEAAEALCGSYNNLLIVVALKRHDVNVPLHPEQIGKMTYALGSQICSQAALSLEQVYGIKEWCETSGIHAMHILEVYGGSGYNASLLDMFTGLPVRSTDISTFDEPDEACCETDEERQQFRKFIAQKERNPSIRISSFEVEKLDSRTAVEKYADSSTLLFICCPPLHRGVVEETIKAFHSKGGRMIAIIGCEQQNCPAPTVWKILRSSYEKSPNSPDEYSAVPLMPFMISIPPTESLFRLQLFERRDG
jgi:protein-L-isoaspartate O-methyltransferase